MSADLCLLLEATDLMGESPVMKALFNAMELTYLIDCQVQATLEGLSGAVCCTRVPSTPVKVQAGHEVIVPPT